AVYSADLPLVEAGRGPVDFCDLSSNILARDKVLYHGHAVAAVAASSERIAEQALKKIKVQYEVLPHVTGLAAAMSDEAPLVHRDMFTRGLAAKPDKPSNIANHTEMSRGDPDAGFAEADVIVERTYCAPTAHQGYIEPQACVVSTHSTGQIDIWCSSQGHFMVRQYTATLLGVDIASIKVTPAEIGGGFGGKTTVYLEPVAALLSQRAGRPVKIVMTREEVFRATGPAAGSIVRVKIGATTEGRITAMEGELAMDAGAYKGSPVATGAMCMFAPYKCPNQRTVARDVVTNKAKTAAYRAPGGPQAHLGAECVVSEVAAELGMDPIDFRLLNAVEEGDTAFYGARFKAIGLKECLRSAKAHPNYGQRLTADQGRGVAVGFWFNFGMQSSATINVHSSGKVTIITGSPDIGGSRASMVLMAAETLGIEPRDIKPIIGDTDSVGFNDLTGGSRTTFASGWAVMNAGQALIETLKMRAAALWEVDIEQVSWVDGQAVALGDSNRPPLSLADLAASAHKTGGPLCATASLNASGAGPGFAVNFCDVAVDTQTGRVDVLRFTAVQDAGKAIHPAYVEGQMEGGAAQGIGWALNEEYIFNDQGILENPGFLDYRIPVASDLPMIDTLIVEVPNPSHPYGVRGVGEPPICAPLAAVTTAVNNAIGGQLTELPLSPPKVLAEIEACS
ncbi:MAG: molybdopterin-dependent oxidoreductase, partial [Halieaceae bacterium]|nr:molybdopterin-dependent oxidoreductase [Halieaceae bacterium]